MKEKGGLFLARSPSLRGRVRGLKHITSPSCGGTERALATDDLISANQKNSCLVNEAFLGEVGMQLG